MKRNIELIYEETERILQHGAMQAAFRQTGLGWFNDPVVDYHPLSPYHFAQQTQYGVPEYQRTHVGSGAQEL